MSRRKKTATPGPTDPPGQVYPIALLFFLIEIAVLPGAYSPFRQPKMDLAIIGLAIVVGGGLAIDFASRRISFPKTPLTAVLLFLPVLQAFSALWAPTPHLALKTAGFSLLWVLAALRLSLWTGSSRTLILRWTLAGVVVSGLVLLLQFFGIAPFQLNSFGQADRLQLTGLCGNPSDLALAGILLLPLLLLPALESPRRMKNWLLPIFIAAIAILTQGLTAIATLFLLGVGLLASSRSRRVMVGATLAVVLPVLIAVGSSAAMRERIGDQFERLQRGEWYTLLSARGDGWTAAATMVENSPFLGVGAGQYSREFYSARRAWLEERDSVGLRGEYPTHFEWAHNDPLQMLSEMGLLGFLWTIALVAAVFRLGRGRIRLLMFAALAWLPFLALHYPTHVAVGLVPAVLILADLMHDCPRSAVSLRRRFVGGAAALAILAAAVWTSYVVVQQGRLNLWRGIAEGALEASQHAPEPGRAQMLEAVQRQAIVQVLEHPSEAHWVWRLVGRALLQTGAHHDAEAAFRKAGALFPHEEAEMGLGLALAGQGRTSEAVYHLTRACTLNPRLIDLIQSEELAEMVRTRLRSGTD